MISAIQELDVYLRNCDLSLNPRESRIRLTTRRRVYGPVGMQLAAGDVWVCPLGYPVVDVVAVGMDGHVFFVQISKYSSHASKLPDLFEMKVSDQSVYVVFHGGAKYARKCNRT